MAVKKRENGSLTGSKRYAAEKGKSVEEQTQENHARALEKVKARFQKPESAVNAVADGVRNIAQEVKGVERAARTVRQVVNGGSSTVTDDSKQSLNKASQIASEYGIKEIEISDLLGTDPYSADANIPEMKAVDANREKLKIQRQNNALEVRLEKIKQGRKVVAVATEQRRLIGDFVDALRGAFRDISSLKTRMYSKGNEEAEADVRAINVAPFIDWAVGTVSNLENNSAKWRSVAIAVMLLTGRRQSEVMASGIFEYADDSHVIFEGQLKRHIDELVAPEKIPVLGNAAKQVVKAIEWLEKHDKRSLPTERTAKAIQEAAKKSHNRCSRYIAEQMDSLTPFVTITNGKNWTFTKDGKTINKFKGHLTRQIYAQVCEKLFSDSDNEKKQSFIARILLEGRDAAVAYDRDIEIKDIDIIKTKYGTVS